jgi:serine/threonine protein kinase
MEKSSADYAILGKVGEGAFGTVFRATERATGVEVALKRIRVRDVRQLPSNVLRELNALRQLDHPHIVRLLGMHTHGANLVLVMPFVPFSLAALLAERDAPLAECDAAAFARMLLQGVTAIHAEGLLHRDLKPANCLVDAAGSLSIADFGQARLLPSDPDASLSHAVATRWFRAPELLFGSRRYGPGVDMWACGCILAQLLTLSALLPGESDIDQLFRVVQFLGTPTADIWPGCESLPDFRKVELPAGLPPTPLRALMPLASDAALEVISPMLVYDAARRTPARTALRSRWVLAGRSVPTPPAALLPSPAMAPAVSVPLHLGTTTTPGPRAASSSSSDAAALGQRDSLETVASAGAPRARILAAPLIEFPAQPCRRAAAPPEGGASLLPMLQPPAQHATNQ